MDERAVQGKKTAGTRGSTRSIAFVALTIALMGVSAWVAIPFGPVMLTLQMFALMFALLALTPRECMAAIAGYLALGAVGLPMFSGMRGGIGMLLRQGVEGFRLYTGQEMPADEVMDKFFA